MAKKSTDPLTKFQDDSVSYFEYLKIFVRNPIRAMDKVPEYHWTSLLIFQAATSVIFGLFAALVTMNFSLALSSIVFGSFTGIITLGGCGGVFYWLFVFFLKKELNYKKITHIIYYASIPSQIFFVFSNWVPGILLVGLAFSSILLVVGFVDTFALKTGSVIKLILATYIVFTLFSLIRIL